MGVIATDALGEDVVDARSLEERTNGATSDYTGTLARRTEQDASRAVLTHNVMRDGAVDDRNSEHRCFSAIIRLTDRLGDLIGLPEPDSDAAVLISDHYECAEAESTTTLHYLGDAVDAHDCVDELHFFVTLIRQFFLSSEISEALVSPLKTAT
jgi:hypothetical protein